MKESPLLSDLLTIFKVISIIGFIATGALILGLSYRGYVKLYREKSEKPKYRGYFIGFSIFIILILMFMYLVLF